jgi:hypothetical protein
MTIRISGSAMLVEPRSTESGRYAITTSRGKTATCEGGQLEFELKFFYDLESNENTVPYAYLANEGIRFTGNFSGITDDVLHINVQQAHTLGIITIPDHFVEVELNGRVSATPKNVTTSIPPISIADSDEHDNNPSDLEGPSTAQISFTMFRITATQWASFPRNDGSPGSTGKTQQFELTIRHEAENRLTSRTTRLKHNQNVNILGLLELINSKLYILLTDIAWSTSQTASGTSHPPTAPAADNTMNPPPRISRSRALAAQLSTLDTTPSTSEAAHKRTKVTEPVNPTGTSMTRNTSKVTPGATPTKPIEIEVQTSSSEELPPTKTRTTRTRRSTTRTKRGKRAKYAKPSQDSGNLNCLSQSPVKMVGGIPQLYNTPDTGRVAKLRDHATSLLPTREFSFF